MIAWGREKRESSKRVNYNEKDLWENGVQGSSDDEIYQRKKKRADSQNRSIARNRQANRRNTRPATRGNNSSRNRKSDYSDTNTSDEYSNEEDSYEEEYDDDEEDNEYDTDEEEDYDSEEEEENSLFSQSMYHRRYKPTHFFEPGEKKPKPRRHIGSRPRPVPPKKKQTKAKKPKKKQKQYSSSESSSDDDDEFVVQAILGIKDPNRETPNQPTENQTATDDEGDETEYYVKFVDRSYQQCKFLKKQELFEYKDGEKAYRRFLIFSNPTDSANLTPSLSIQNLLVTDESSLKTDYYEIDRIINDANEHNKREYLVKWKSLEYSEATWEFAEDIKEPSKIKEYEERLEHSNPIRLSTRYVRPKLDQFEEITKPPESKINTALRDYQLAGLNWLRNCWYSKRNNILADEMGLGKTAQMVCFLNDLALNQGLTGPFLVAAPLSTLAHWKMEFERWTDLNCVVFHGNKKSREMIVDYEIHYFDDEGRRQPNRVGFDVIVTNYDTLRSESRLFGSIQWRYLIVDEAHRMKNSSSKLFSQLKQLVWDHCTLLTGTPIQNDMSELWSLLNFIDPKNFHSKDDFMEKYGVVTDISQVSDVRSIIKPYLLRRRKGDVEKEILPKDETIIEVELTRTQKQFYKAFLNDNASELLQRITSSRSHHSLLNLMMQLRKVCNHPFLIVDAEKSIVDEMRKKNKELSRRELHSMARISSSGKMILIDKLLPKLKSDDHKVLIFSQMVKILDILEAYLIEKNYLYERLDGSVSETQRQQSIERFNTDRNRFVFLLSTKAGGIGINLTSADTVIIFDSDWNPQNDIQAEARCHRIGQTSTVKVYRLLTRNTYENEMFVRASKKLALDHLVLDGASLNDQPMKAEEIEKILRHGAYSIFADSNDNEDEENAEIDQFVAADIDQILESRSRPVKQDIVAGGGSVFSSVTYNLDNSNDGDEMNATDFWAPLFESENLNGDNLNYNRRCKDDVKKLSVNDVRKLIQSMIQFGYPSIDNDSEIARSVLQIAYSLDPPRKQRNIDIIHYYLRGSHHKKVNDDDENSESEDSEQENFDLEDPTKTYGNEVVFLFEDKSELIISRVIYFYRLRENLFRAQGNGYKWPSVKPFWDSPLKEYALMVGVLKHGLFDISAIFSDQSLGLEHSKELKKKQVENRVRGLFEGIEHEFIMNYRNEQKKLKQNEETNEKEEHEESENEIEDDDDENDVEILYLDVPKDFVPVSPSEWAQNHPEFFSENLLNDKELNAIIQFVLEFGIPLLFHDRNDDEDSEGTIDAVEIIKKSGKSLENVTPDVLRSFLENLMLVISRLGEDDNESDNENENNDSIDLSDFPELQKLSTTRLKNLKNSIDVMNKVYRFLHFLKLHPEIEQFMTSPKEKSQFPDWWDQKCDRCMMESFTKYGQNFVYSMLDDKKYPFYNNLSVNDQTTVHELADSERNKGKPGLFDENTISSSLKALFSRRSRIPRVLTIIRHAMKKFESHRSTKRKHRPTNTTKKSKEEKPPKKSKEPKPQKEQKPLKQEKQHKTRAKPQPNLNNLHLLGDTLQDVVYHLKHPSEQYHLERNADFYLNSRRFNNVEEFTVFGQPLACVKRNLRVFNYGEVRTESQFAAGKTQLTLNPGFVSVRKYPIFGSDVFPIRWYLCEIIERDNRPYFELTDLDDPDVHFECDELGHLFELFFDYLRRKYLPQIVAKRKKTNREIELTDEEIQAEFDKLDIKEQKIVPYRYSAFKAYTIIGLTSSKEDRDEPNENHETEHKQQQQQSQQHKSRSRSDVQSDLLPMIFDIPLFDIEIFPQLKEKYQK